MKTTLRAIGLGLLLFGAAIAGAWSTDSYRQWQSLAPERAVASLPGVGAGWLDTLRRVAGGDPVTIDTINAVEIRWGGNSLLGLHEPFHHIISIRLDPKSYPEFIRTVSEGDGSWEYQHPVTVATPPTVVAHEFGHHFAFTAASEFSRSEEFADRFARAMMALRGWDTADPRDIKLYHRLRYRLMASYWPETGTPIGTPEQP
jgi:hypothetical protein